MSDDPRLHEVTLTLCELCLSGAGGECHVPGCALWMKSAPDVPLDPSPGCEDLRCTRLNGRCVGMHCANCGEPYSSQGHFNCEVSS